MKNFLSAFLVLLFTLALSFGQAKASDFNFQQIKIQVENNAKVNNTTDTNSNTGGNTTTVNGGGNANVQTGNAGSKTVICNDVNHTVINGTDTSACPPAVSPTSAPTTAPTPTQGPTNGGGCTSNCGGGNNSPSSSGGGPNSSPSQQVLGTSTLAATGTFEENLMAAMAVLGILFLGIGSTPFALRKVKQI